MYGTGFAVMEKFPISEWVIQDANGGPADAAEKPEFANRGDLLEVDDEIKPPRARLRLGSTTYMVGQFPAPAVVDLNAYAAKSVDTFQKKHDEEDLHLLAQQWIQENAILSWASPAPSAVRDGHEVQAIDVGLVVADVQSREEQTINFGTSYLLNLDLEELEPEVQELRQTSADGADGMDLVLVFQKWIQQKRILRWKDPAPFPVDELRDYEAIALGLVVADMKTSMEVTIKLGELSLDRVYVKRSDQEEQEREQAHADHAELPLMAVERVMALLATVDLIGRYLPNQPPAVIKVASDDAKFDDDAAEYCAGSGQELAAINGFTDKSTNPITILLRPRAKGVGTEVHEMLHALAHDDYVRSSWFFFNEGITEYLTRKATGGSYDREKSYLHEHAFINILVDIGATDDATLAKLYFTGDWKKFEEKVREFAGDWVSFQALRTVSPATVLGVRDYLTELAANKRAPLGPEPIS
jgi:hypothetical protein